MRWLTFFVVFSAPVFVTHIAVAQNPTLNRKLGNRIEFRALNQKSKSFGWSQGIKNKDISVSEYIISPKDTYSSIIEKNGIRSDPNSIEVFKKLNKNRYPVRKLPPGKTMVIIRNQGDEHLEIMLDRKLKQKLELKEKILRDQRKQLNSWVGRQNNEQKAIQIKKLQETLISRVQQLKTTGYALDRTALKVTDEALGMVKQITEELIQKNKPPSNRLLRFLEKIASAISSFSLSAQNTDAPYINTQIETISHKTQKPIDKLNVCFKYAIALWLFQAEESNRGKKPNWPCNETFDSLSSPASKLFKSELKYVVWAKNNLTRVSEYRVITIIANQRDGSFKFELGVTGN